MALRPADAGIYLRAEKFCEETLKQLEPLIESTQLGTTTELHTVLKAIRSALKSAKSLSLQLYLSAMTSRP